MKKDGNIPSKEAWGEILKDDLDMQAAYNDFFGKSNRDMREAYANYSIEMVDSLRWMPPVPFRYYIKGFAEFLLSDGLHKIDASDAASSFLRLIEEKLRKQSNLLAPIIDDVLPVVRHLAENQEAFEVDVEIYGDFKEKRETIESLCAAYDAQR
ncbi:hypothetical protein [Undibacterium flavidum]|uniref:Uncharacterized protein n=1 Tax=Undibacterium flavidum TaxID=2762297 RepID=A0ABR6YAT9_9BURK|nr:hypothetical protein [Undibacterium flavidum]MBC3873747.1 hypothetical protein [Undibacterium flavidum]